jgi:integrase/recombinase XerD
MQGAAVFDQNGRRKYLNGLERRAYLQAIGLEPDARQRAFCLTLYYCGCRISEALNLPVERIDLTGKAVVFETLKRRKPGHFRAVPVPDALADLLRELVTGKSADAKIWAFSRTTAYRLIKAKMQQAGIHGSMACPKGLRHGHGVACVGGKVPLTTIQKWLGHARIETTAIYLDVHGEEERELAKRLWAAD